MKYIKFTLIILVVGPMLYYYLWVRSDQKQQPLNDQRWETKTNDQLPVTIKITPVKFDTHSGSLDDDPTQIVVLTDDRGNAYKPIAWEGPGPGGHHREGVLVFNPVYPTPAYVELKIKNVGSIPERVFRWDTK